MRAWAIKLECFESATQTIRIEGRRRPGISNSDNAILFGRQSDNEVRFTAFGTIASADVTGEDRDTVVFTARLQDMVELDPPRNLTDFAYSLQKIYIYQAPGRHFRNQYTSLEQADFHALVKARIFWARTAFGLFANELPDDTLADFVRFTAEVNPRSLIGRSEFAILWKLLQTFITQEYESAYQLLEHVSDDVARLREADVDIQFADIHVGEKETGGSTDSLMTQHQRLAAFAASLAARNERPEGLFQAIDTRIADSADVQDGFEAAYRRTLWPMHRTNR